MFNSRLVHLTEFWELRRETFRTYSSIDSGMRGRPLLIPLHKQPVSWSCRCHLWMAVELGRQFSLFLCRNSRWTITMNSVTSSFNTQNTFCCGVGIVIKRNKRFVINSSYFFPFACRALSAILIVWTPVLKNNRENTMHLFISKIYKTKICAFFYRQTMLLVLKVWWVLFIYIYVY